MYAILQSGGKQHLVRENEIIRIEKLKQPKGTIVQFNEIIMSADNKNINIGMPFLKNCIITAQIINHGCADKVHILKFRRRKHYRKHQGHRQWFTEIKITNIII